MAELLKAKPGSMRCARRSAGLAGLDGGRSSFHNPITVADTYDFVAYLSGSTYWSVHLRSADGTRMSGRMAASASDAVRAHFSVTLSPRRDRSDTLRRLAPRAVITCARGSSDHAATYAST